MKKIMKSKHRKLIFSVILVGIFYLNFVLLSINTNINSNSNDPNEIFDNNSQKENLMTQDLDSDNTYSGIGAPWNVTHWANRTDYDKAVSFTNDSYDIAEIPLGSNWEGYKLNANVKDLYDTRNWNNGTFNFGNDDNSYTAGEDDTNEIVDWTFGYHDTDPGFPQLYSGNYLDSSAPNSGGHDCLELRIDGWEYDCPPPPCSYFYDKEDSCWWNSSIKIPRGKVIDSELKFDAKPNHMMDFNDFELIFYLNNEKIYSIGAYNLKQLCGGEAWKTFNIPQGLWINTSNIYTNPVNNSIITINITLMEIFDCGYGSGFANNDYQQLFIDNVELITKTEAKPSQISLKMNNINVIDIDWGKGAVEQDNTWTTSPVQVNFTSGDTGDFNIELKADLNLYAIKNTPETSHEMVVSSSGTSFSVSNNSVVNWDAYVYTSVPTGYKETEMRLEFPTDVNITWVSEPQNPINNNLTLCNDSTPGLLIIPVPDISTLPDGFWKFEGLSPNYCEQLEIYNNATGSWVLDNEFLSGDFINITAKINDSSLITDHIQQTKAQLHVRFPNGTIWTEQNQFKSPNANGLIYFDYFQIPDSPPNYEVGEYEAIITWNNSYNPGLNETGVIYKKFTVIHESKLTLDQSYYGDNFEGDLINLKVSFNDLVGNPGVAIRNAQVYLDNFTGGRQFFSEISPGYYFLEFNTTGGTIPGDNNLTIYANSSLYVNNKVNVTIELVLSTELTAEEYPSLQVPWNENFTIHLNYTKKSNGDGISTTPTNNWIGETHTVEGAAGVYNITCNSSAYEVNKLHSLIINVDKTGYESQSILIKIEIIERDTFIDDIFLNQTLATSISIPWNETLNVTITYKDTSSSNCIDGATVQLTGAGISEVLTENGQQYTVIINVADIGVGIKSLTVTAQKQNYSMTSEVITITVTERDSYIDDIFLNQTLTTSISIPWNETLNVTITYKDTLTGNYIDAATVELIGAGISEVLNENGQQYTVIINVADIGIGVKSLTISAQKQNYSITSEVITITVSERDSYIDEIFLNQTLATNIEIPWNETLNITITYKDTLTGNYLDAATVELTGAGISEVLNENGQQYTVIINVADIGVGIKILTVSAQKQNYTFTSEVITITVNERDSYIDEIFLNQTLATSIEIPWNETLNITITYKDTLTGDYVDAATVELTGAGISEVLIENGQQYTVIINTADLGVGIKFLTVSAQKQNYSITSELITITVNERDTDLNIFLNQTLATSTVYPHGELLNITVLYKDQLSGGTFIDGATVQLKDGETVLRNLTKHSTLDQYNLTINTAVFGVGVNALIIYAKLDNYTLSLVSITITVNERTTTTDIYLNQSLQISISYPYSELLNITAIYKDQLSGGTFIENATVLLKDGALTIGTLNKHATLDQYELIINTSIFGVDIKALSIYAKKDNYSVSLSSITLNIEARLTYFEKIYLNTLDKTSDKSITLTNGELINITIVYRDLLSNSFINNATATLKRGAIWEKDLTKSPFYDQYSIILNTTTDLGGLASVQLVISAVKQNYTEIIDSITIFITVRGSNYTLIVESVDITSLPEIQRNVNQTVNITLIYRDFLLQNFLENATVRLKIESTWYNLSENTILQFYNITINTNDLPKQFNSLAIEAEKAGYETKLITFTIEIIERNTQLDLYMNGMNKTAEPSIKITFGIKINITVNYTDVLTSKPFGNATVELLGDYIANLTFYSATQLYSIVIDSFDLELGINFINVFASRSNYQFQKILIQIEVLRILGKVVTESGADILKAEPGDNLVIKIRITNTVFGGLIPNAKVTYTSNMIRDDIRAGEFTEVSSGVYELTIQNIPEGTYTIIISVTFKSATDLKLYEVPQKELTLDIVRPSEDVLLFQILLGVAIAAIAGLTIYLIAYQKVLKYPKPVRKVRGCRKNLKKTKELDVDIPDRESAFNMEFEAELGKVGKLLKKKPIEKAKLKKLISQIKAPPLVPSEPKEPAEVPKDIAPKALKTPKEIPKALKVKITAVEKKIKQLITTDSVKAAEMMSELAALYEEAGEERKAQYLYDKQKKITIELLKNMQADLLIQAQNAEDDGNWDATADAYLEAKEMSEGLLKAGLTDEADKVKEYALLENKFRKKALQATKEISKDLKVKIEAIEKEIKQLMKKDNVKAAQTMSELAALYKEAGDEKKAQQILDDQKKLTIHTLKNMRTEVLKKAKKVEKEGNWEAAADMYSEAKEISENLLKAGLAAEADKVKEYTSLENKCRNKIQ